MKKLKYFFASAIVLVAVAVSTIVFAKGFYVLNQILQETLFSFCRLLGSAVVTVLEEPVEE